MDPLAEQASWTVTPPEVSAEFARPDPNDNDERILTEVMLGVPKEKSRHVVTDEDSRLWDALVAARAKLPPGAMIIYGWRYTED